MSRKQTSMAGPFSIATTSATEIQLAANNALGVECVFLHQIDITNSSGANANIAYGYQYLNNEWKAGQFDDSAGASYIEDTTDAQDVGTADFALFSVNNNNDGFVIQCQQPFNGLAINVNVAPSGGSPAYGYQYWNGSDWASLTVMQAPTYTNATLATMIFAMPTDMALLVSTDTPVATDGLSANYYAIKVRATTAPETQAGSADKIRVLRVLDFFEDAPAGGTVYRKFDQGLFIPHQRPIVPIVIPADSGNSCTVEYRKGA